MPHAGSRVVVLYRTGRGPWRRLGEFASLADGLRASEALPGRTVWLRFRPVNPRPPSIPAGSPPAPRA